MTKREHVQKMVMKRILRAGIKGEVYNTPDWVVAWYKTNRVRKHNYKKFYAYANKRSK